MPRPAAVLILAAALLGTACDSPTRTSDLTGRYRLVSVAGGPVPFLVPPSLGQGTIRGGDLLLRGDGSFALGTSEASNDAGLLYAGRWSAAGSRLKLEFEGGNTITGTVAGDSVAMVLQFPMLYRRAPFPATPVNSGIWVLTSVDGRSDLTSMDTAGDVTWHQRLHYDSILLTDALFFRRARSQSRQMWIGGTPAPLSVHSGWFTHGTIESATADLMLVDYGRMQAAVDTLDVLQNTLTRRLPYLDATGAPATRLEVYTRAQ
jgi:hypothetical protein